ncbi:MAG TPA: permease, partial [Mycobacteriales bacterium]|nr:permease [Mycobacteriales bacterium]
ATARASGLGMVSSSCSYAATAMAKSLFAKGADFVAAMVFMFASTNLVIELGVVLVILLGWQFAAAEFVGGPIMIALLALTGGLVMRRSTVAAARRRLQQTAAATVAGGQAMAHEGHGEPSGAPRGPAPASLRSAAAWSDAASYTMADLRMLRRELVIGYLVAGFLATLVPIHVWNAVFLHGHGGWTSAENVVVGPVVAIASFVCSVGNVPLAAALWKGGISFGGVISFIFADLITFPLLLIYRKYYGTRVALRLLAWFGAVMAIAGLVVEGLARAVGLVPTHRPTRIVSEHIQANYTTVLNVVLLAVFGLLYWLHRNRQRLGGGQGYAIDPVCGMQVRTADAPATATRDGERYWFCSDRCRDRFLPAPSRRPRGPLQQEEAEGGSSAPAAEDGRRAPDGPQSHSALDPVCGMAVDDASAPARRTLGTRTYLFCGVGCARAFDADLARYAATASPDTER